MTLGGVRFQWPLMLRQMLEEQDGPPCAEAGTGAHFGGLPRERSCVVSTELYLFVLPIVGLVRFVLYTCVERRLWPFEDKG